MKDKKKIIIIVAVLIVVLVSGIVAAIGIQGKTNNEETTTTKKEKQEETKETTKITTTEITSEKDSDIIYLNDYISVSFVGYNQGGYAEISFDKEEFLLDSVNLVSFNQTNLKAYRDLYGDDGKSAAYALCKFFSPKITGNEHLSNGDTIEIVWDLDEEKIETYFNCDINYGSKEFIVEGLDEAKSYDPFENVRISFSGIEPNGTVTILPADKYDGEYSISKSTGLSNGDVITVTYSCRDTAEMIAMYHTYPSIYEKEYKVKGLSSFPDNIDDFPSKVLADIDTIADDYFSKFKETPYQDMVVNKYSVEGYALITKPVNVGEQNSRFFAIYSVDATAVCNTQSQKTKYYVMFEFENPIIENGNFSMKTSNYSIASHTTNAITFNEKNYTAYVRTDGFNSKEEIDEYLNKYIGSNSNLAFQTYK